VEDIGEQDFSEPPLTGESYAGTGQRETRGRRKGPSVLVLILLVLLGIIVVGAVAFLVYRAVEGPRSTAATQPVTVAKEPAAQQPTAPQPAAAQPAATAPTPVTAPAPAATAPAAPTPQETYYRIKQGDTLWDISATYYRNPWLYPRLAKANSIKNPDLIFAGTRIVIPPN